MGEMEDYLNKECQDIDYTVVRPPGLTNQPSTGNNLKLTIEPVIKIFFWIVQSVGHCHLYGRNVQMLCIISFIFYVKFVLIIF